MAKKKITIGHSSKNGQKALQEKYIYGERTYEQIQELSEEHLEAEISFPPKKDDSFEKVAYKVSALLSGDSSHLNKILQEEQDELFENIKKLYLLCDHYGIDPNNPQHFMLLSIEMARELFPHSPTKKQGRKQKWSKVIEATFVIDMERIINTRKKITHAATILARNPIWSNFIEGRTDIPDAKTLAGTIRTEYSKIRKKGHIAESRKRLDEMSQAEFEAHREKVVRKLPTF